MTESDWHADVISYLKQALQAHFTGRSDVYVASNVYVYYRKGDPSGKVSPDVFVCFGVSSEKRKSFKSWEARATPQVVVEVTSESSRLSDQGDKRARYQEIGVEEYYLFDPLGEYLPGQLRVYRREGEELVPVLVQGRCQSPLLGVELVVEGTLLRVYSASTGVRYNTTEEERLRVAALEEELGRLRERLGES